MYKYKNNTMNYAMYVVRNLQSTETRGASGGIEEIMDYIEENLLKVICLVNVNVVNTFV